MRESSAQSRWGLGIRSGEVEDVRIAVELRRRSACELSQTAIAATSGAGGEGVTGDVALDMSIDDLPGKMGTARPPGNAVDLRSLFQAPERGSAASRPPRRGAGRPRRGRRSRRRGTDHSARKEDRRTARAAPHAGAAAGPYRPEDCGGGSEPDRPGKSTGRSCPFPRRSRSPRRGPIHVTGAGRELVLVLPAGAAPERLLVM